MYVCIRYICYVEVEAVCGLTGIYLKNHGNKVLSEAATGGVL